MDLIKNGIMSLKERYKNRERSRTFKEKKYYRKTMSLSRFKSIKLAIYDRLYPFNIWLRETIDRNGFFIEYPECFTVESYSSSYVKEQKNIIKNLEETDVENLKCLVLTFRDYRRYYRDVNDGKDPYKADDTKFIKRMEDFKNLLENLIIKYYQMKIGDDESLQFKVERIPDNRNVVFYITTGENYYLDK